MSGFAKGQIHLAQEPMTAITIDRVEELERADLKAMSGLTVGVTKPIRFGQSLGTDLNSFRWLQEATSYAIRLVWTVDGKPLLEAHDFSHLIPPSAFIAQDSADVAARWRRDFRYGTFYYRVGPGFITIKDVRPGCDHSRMTVSGDDAEQFLRLAHSSHRQANNDLLDSALSALREAGLAQYTQSRQLVLPFRIRHWPVPFLSI